MEPTPAELLAGHCESCGKDFTLVQARLTPAEGPAGEAAAPAKETAEGPACPECGQALEIRFGRPGTLVASCGDCGTRATYSLARPGRGPPGPREEFRGREPRGRFDREGSDVPPSRPCRECGGELRFTKNEDGTVTGECASCGNKFTLPPRRTDRRGSDRGGRPYRPRPPGGSRYDRGRSGGDRPRRFGNRRPSYGDGRARRRPSYDE